MCGCAQTKLVLALREYRLLHASASRGSSLPHNKLLFPPTLRYLPIWILGAAPESSSHAHSMCGVFLGFFYMRD